MSSLLKLIFLLIIITGFFILTGFIYYRFIYLHIIIFLLISVLHSWRFSLKGTFRLLIMLLPFTLTIFLFGLIFQLIHLQGRTDWLMDSLIKVVYFPSSFLFIKLMISLFSYRDILNLPLNKEFKTDIVFLEIFINKAFAIMPRLEFHINNHPHLQSARGLAKKFLLLCSFPLALYIFLMEEGATVRKIFLNRQTYLEDKF